MKPFTAQIQDLLEGLDHLRQEQAALLASTETREVDALHPLDLAAWQRLEQARRAKGQFLARLAGTREPLPVLIGQLARLGQERQGLLQANACQSPISLPIKALKAYTQLWEMSDRVLVMIQEQVPGQA